MFETNTSSLNILIIPTAHVISLDKASLIAIQLLIHSINICLENV